MFAEAHVDFGTGDGAFAYRTARRWPSALVIGVDANPALMREVSQRASRKPARGGVPNVLFGRLSLEEAPGDLIGLADVLTVFFPWGSLLRAVAAPDNGLRKLAAVGKRGGRIHFLYGYGSRESAVVKELGVPELGSGDSLSYLEKAYAAAGLEVEAHYAAREDVALAESTWAKKLAFSPRARAFVEIRGTIHL